MMEQLQAIPLWIRVKKGRVEACVSSWLFSRKRDMRKYLRRERKKYKLSTKLRNKWLFWRL